MGGLSKKAFQVKELVRDTKQPALLVTGGNLLFGQDQLPEEVLAPAKIAAQGVVTAHRKMGASFAGIGSNDLAAGVGFLKQLEAQPGFTWLSLNLLDPVAHTPLFTPILYRQVAETKIAFVALANHTTLANKHKGLLAVDWRTVLPQALAEASKEADCIVLLSNYSFAENREIALAYGAIDLISVR